MQAKPSLEDTLSLMRDLRARCEWDAAQTHESLRPYLIEEAYEVDDAIRGGDVGQLVRIPGVGKKTAERMVLELKDKLEGLGGGAPPAVLLKSDTALNDVEQDVLSALVNLGCQRAAADAAVRKAKSAEPGLAFEPLFRRALELVR